MQPPSGHENLADYTQQLHQIVAQQHNVPLDDIKVVTQKAVEWPDSCLGVPEAGELCTPGQHWGRQVVLALAGEHYTYHLNDSPLQIRLAAAPPPALGELVIEWSFAVKPCARAEMASCQAYTGAVTELQGSVQCESAWIGRERIAFGPCGGAMMAVNLREERPQQLAKSAATFAPFRAQTPAGYVIFSGQGSTRATPVEQRMIAEWARMTQLEAGMGRAGASWGHLLSWQRTGGPEKFCEGLSVNLTGVVDATSCALSTPPHVAWRFMQPTELTKIYTWHATLQPLRLKACYACDDEQPESSLENQATVDLIFSGIGESAATPAEQQAMLDFAEKLYMSLAR